MELNKFKYSYLSGTRREYQPIAKGLLAIMVDTEGRLHDGAPVRLSRAPAARAARGRETNRPTVSKPAVACARAASTALSRNSSWLDHTPIYQNIVLRVKSDSDVYYGARAPLDTRITTAKGRACFGGVPSRTNTESRARSKRAQIGQFE